MGGLSDARNVGINNANGKYLCFIDSDDYIDLNYVEELYNAIKCNNTKMSQCNILKVNDSNEVIEKVGYYETTIKTGKELIKEMYREHIIENIVVWNKMYEKSLFNNLRYPAGKIHEDEFVTYKILYSVEKVAIINRYLYNYRQNEHSITGKQFNIRRLDSLYALNERLEFFKQREEKELYQLTLEKYMQTIRSCYINTRKYIQNSNAIQKELKSEYRKKSKMFLENYNCSILKKIKIDTFNIFPIIYYIKYNLKQLGKK